MTDVWWGLVEQKPGSYNWSAYPTFLFVFFSFIVFDNFTYEQLVQLVQKVNLTIKVIMSFRIHIIRNDIF